MQLSFLLSILLLSKCIYALNKQYLNRQTISRIKYCCFGESHEKPQIQTSPLQEWYIAFSLQKRLQVIKSAAILTRTEILTILSPEAEGPENVRKWSL